MKSNEKLTLLFWHRKSRADGDGFAPVICRISIEGEKEEELSIGKKVHLGNWDIKWKQAKKGCKEANETNAKISAVSVDLLRTFNALQLEYEHISPLMLKNIYQGKPVENKKGQPKPEPAPPPPTLLEAADIHIANFKKMVDNGHRSGETLKQWNSTRTKIEEFIIYQYGSKDIDLADIEFSFAQEFYNYLTLDRKELLQEAAAKKQVKNTKQILTFAETSKWIPKNPIEKFKCGGDETDIPPLEYYEIDQLWKKDFSITRLAEVRDVFVFQCFTGFAFQDVYNMTPENIVRVGITGERWLIKDRGKTGVSEMVPISPIVEEIIEKYSSHRCCTVEGLLLPVNSNSRYNGYLKEIAIIAGINRELNTHLARHTFGDLMLNVFGFSLEEVSKMMGHKTVRTTQRYAKVRKNKISQTWSRVKSIVFTEDGQLRKIAS